VRDSHVGRHSVSSCWLLLISPTAWSVRSASSGHRSAWGTWPHSRPWARGTPRPARGGERHGARTERAPTSWLQSPDGRKALAFDSAWLRSYPSLRPATRDGGVVWRGPIDAGPVVVSCAYYLPGQPGTTPVAEFSGDEGAVSLRIALAEAASRAARFAAALAALAALADPPDPDSTGDSARPAGVGQTPAVRDRTGAVPDDPVLPQEDVGPGQPHEATSNSG